MKPLKIDDFQDPTVNLPEGKTTIFLWVFLWCSIKSPFLVGLNSTMFGSTSTSATSRARCSWIVSQTLLSASFPVQTAQREGAWDQIETCISYYISYIHYIVCILCMYVYYKIHIYIYTILYHIYILYYHIYICTNIWICVCISKVFAQLWQCFRKGACTCIKCMLCVQRVARVVHLLYTGAGELVARSTCILSTAC